MKKLIFCLIVASMPFGVFAKECERKFAIHARITHDSAVIYEGIRDIEFKQGSFHSQGKKYEDINSHEVFDAWQLIKHAVVYNSIYIDGGIDLFIVNEDGEKIRLESIRTSPEYGFIVNGTLYKGNQVGYGPNSLLVGTQLKVDSMSCQISADSIVYQTNDKNMIADRQPLELSDGSPRSF